MRRALAGAGLLTALLFAIDRLYRVLHPVVDLERAGLVGLGALAALLLLARMPLPEALRVRPLPGALAILTSAAVSVLLIQAGVLVSRSLVSGAVHAAILAVAYALLARPLRAATPVP